ncbi:MAG TPA: SGNH/GDSL hydrolase family protein [Kineosporiaceae bacterium]
MSRHRADQPGRRSGLLPVVVAAVMVGASLTVVAWWPQPSSVAASMARLRAGQPAPQPPPAAPATADGTTPDGTTPSGTTPPVMGGAAGHGRAAPARTSGTYRVVGLGDSVPAGRACNCSSFVSLAGRQLAAQQGLTASVDNLAVNGLRSSDLLDQLTSDAVRAEIAAADLVIIMVGANDFDPGILTTDECLPLPELPCYQRAFAQQRANLASVLSQITALTAPRDGTVVTAGYWNVFLDGDVGQAHGEAYVKASDALTRADNALISEVSQAANVAYADVYTPFKGDGATDVTALLAPDGDHPDAAGHAIIAKAVVDAVT